MHLIYILVHFCGFNFIVHFAETFENGIKLFFWSVAWNSFSHDRNLSFRNNSHKFCPSQKVLKISSAILSRDSTPELRRSDFRFSHPSIKPMNLKMLIFNDSLKALNIFFRFQYLPRSKFFVNCWHEISYQQWITNLCIFVFI